LEQIEIIEKTLEVFKKCDVKTFPIDCINIITGLGIPLYKYSDLPEVKARKCLQVSNDAFTLQGVIFYNDNFPHTERQRFSLMHEVGHIVLNHEGESSGNEIEADLFASNILAPRSIIWHLHFNSVKDICEIFNVSCMAANRILKDYKTFPLWEHKNLHKNIRDWFFPYTHTTTNIAMEKESDNYDNGSDFLKVHRFIVGEEYIFKCSEYYHLHGPVF
jgi:hypothetical protein